MKNSCFRSPLCYYYFIYYLCFMFSFVFTQVKKNKKKKTLFGNSRFIVFRRIFSYYKLCMCKYSRLKHMKTMIHTTRIRIRSEHEIPMPIDFQLCGLRCLRFQFDCNFTFFYFCLKCDQMRLKSIVLIKRLPS
jgi:hypothetical protein